MVAFSVDASPNYRSKTFKTGTLNVQLRKSYDYMAFSRRIGELWEPFVRTFQAHYTDSIVSYMVSRLKPTEADSIWERAGVGDLIDGLIPPQIHKFI